MSTPDEILKDLNPEQLAAVTHDKGPLLVIAGAGTGKTTVITRRIAYLIAAKKAKPGEILALTFTEKAADEMECRVDQLVPYGYVDVSISTFHAFGDRVLRDYAIELKMRPDYRVLTFAEQMMFMRDHIFELPLKHYFSLGDPAKYVEAMLKVFSRAKDEDVSPKEYLAFGKEKQAEVARAYKKYQELKLEKGFVDFGDQVNLTLKLFREHPAILKEFQERYKYILVDEFQDTNYAQFELLKLLAKKNKNIAVVGDDDQAIYKFRGASVSNILNFEKVYKKSKKVVLVQNYRSSQIILDSAYRLIQHNNPDRLEIKSKVEKKLCALPRQGETMIEHKHFDTIYSEADWVAQTIKEKAGKYKLKDFAILTRSNMDAEPFRQSLNMAGLANQSAGGGGLYRIKEVRLLISFLRVIGDLSDSVSLYDLACSSLYQIDALELQKLNTFADRRNLTLHYVFSHLNDQSDEFKILSDLKPATRETIAKIMSEVASYIDYAKERSTGEVLYLFLKQSGFLKKLADAKTADAEEKIKNIARFFDKVKEFHGVADVDKVSEFVKYLNIIKESGDDPESAQPDLESDAVNILTVHKAKGLEFEVVFLVSLVDGKFPVRDRKDQIELPLELVKDILPAGDFHIQEERRLFYVGMTRAKTELYLTSAVDYGGKRSRKLSPFVLEAIDRPKADIEAFKGSPLGQLELFADRPAVPKNKIQEKIIGLSFYQIDDYLICPLKYKYANIVKVPLLPNHQILYGSALHKAVQAYSLAKLRLQKFSLEDLLAVFKNSWSSEGFISREHEELRYKSGKAALTRFFSEQEKTKSIPFYVEESFTILKDDIRIRGRFDRVDKKGEQVVIIDYKSSDVRKAEDAEKKAKDNLQLSIYAIAWQQMFSKIPDRVELHFLDTGLVGSCEKTQNDLDKAWEKIKKAAAGIRGEDFKANPGAFSCRWCAYSEICPASSA